jgi:hypothetical protein
MDAVRERYPQRFGIGLSVAVVLHDIGSVRMADGSEGNLIVCVSRDGREVTWFLRHSFQMGKGEKQRLKVNKVLWAQGVRR